MKGERCGRCRRKRIFAEANEDNEISPAAVEDPGTSDLRCLGYRSAELRSKPSVKDIRLCALCVSVVNFFFLLPPLCVFACDFLLLESSVETGKRKVPGYRILSVLGRRRITENGRLLLVRDALEGDKRVVLNSWRPRINQLDLAARGDGNIGVRSVEGVHDRVDCACWSGCG